MTAPRRRAAFLDRDGTINVDRGYLYRPEEFAFLPGAIAGMKLLEQAGYQLVIVTNQSGIARGYYTEADYRALNAWMLETLSARGVTGAATYYCPHHPEGTVAAYRKVCPCRKPEPGLFTQAAKDLGVDLDESVAIGDRLRDMAPCYISRCRGYLLGNEGIPPELAHVERAESLLAAAKRICGA